MKCLFLIVSMWLHRSFFGFWTIQWYLNQSWKEVSVASCTAPLWWNFCYITLSTGKPLLGSGSLEGRYTWRNVRVFCFGVVFLSVSLLLPATWVSILICYGSRPFSSSFLITLDCYSLWVILFSQCSYVHFICRWESVSSWYVLQR